MVKQHSAPMAWWLGINSHLYLQKAVSVDSFSSHLLLASLNLVFMSTLFCSYSCNVVYCSLKCFLISFSDVFTSLFCIIVVFLFLLCIIVTYFYSVKHFELHFLYKRCFTNKVYYYFYMGYCVVQSVHILKTNLHVP